MTARETPKPPDPTKSVLSLSLILLTPLSETFCDPQDAVTLQDLRIIKFVFTVP